MIAACESARVGQNGLTISTVTAADGPIKRASPRDELAAASIVALSRFA